MQPPRGCCGGVHGARQPTAWKDDPPSESCGGRILLFYYAVQVSKQTIFKLPITCPADMFSVRFATPSSCASCSPPHWRRRWGSPCIRECNAVKLMLDGTPGYGVQPMGEGAAEAAGRRALQRGGDHQRPASPVRRVLQGGWHGRPRRRRPVRTRCAAAALCSLCL